jgi:hypothetical protein
VFVDTEGKIQLLYYWTTELTKGDISEKNALHSRTGQVFYLIAVSSEQMCYDNGVVVWNRTVIDYEAIFTHIP